jgi:hypothetical protein
MEDITFVVCLLKEKNYNHYGEGKSHSIEGSCGKAIAA